jgi:hypothetical protein
MLLLPTGLQIRQIFIKGNNIGIVPFASPFCYFGSKGLGMEAGKK